MAKKTLIMLSIFCAMCAAGCDYNELGGYYKFKELTCIDSNGTYKPELDECRCNFGSFQAICTEGRVCDAANKRCVVCNDGASYCSNGKLIECENGEWTEYPCSSNKCIEEIVDGKQVHKCAPPEIQKENRCDGNVLVLYQDNAEKRITCADGCDEEQAKCKDCLDHWPECESGNLYTCSDGRKLKNDCKGAGCENNACKSLVTDDTTEVCDSSKEDYRCVVDKQGKHHEEYCDNNKWVFKDNCDSTCDANNKNCINGCTVYCKDDRTEIQCIDGIATPKECSDEQVCNKNTGRCESHNTECPDNCKNNCDDNGKCKCPDSCKGICDENGECECPDGCNECSKNGECSDKITCNYDSDCTNSVCVDNRCIKTSECKPRCKTETIAIACDFGKEKELTCKRNEQHCDNGECVSNTPSCTDKDLKCENGIPTFCKEGEWKSFKDQCEKDGSCAYICRDTSLFKCTDTKIEEIGLNKCDGEYYCDSIIVAQSTPYYTASLCGGECNNGKCLTKQCREHKYACAPNLKQSCTNDDCCTFIECDDGECIKDNIIDSTIEKPNPKSELCSERTDCTFTAPYRCDDNKGSIEFLDDTTCSYNKITPNSEQETKYKSIESKQFFCKNLYNDQYHYCDNQDTQNEQATEMKELCGECVNNMDLMLNNSTVKIKTIAFKDDYICKKGLQAVFDSECINTNSRCSLKKSNITLFCIRGANNLYYEFKLSTCLGKACQYTLTPCVNGCDEKFERCNPDATIPTNPPGEEPG